MKAKNLFQILYFACINNFKSQVECNVIWFTLYIIYINRLASLSSVILIGIGGEIILEFCAHNQRDHNSDKLIFKFWDFISFVSMFQDIFCKVGWIEMLLFFILYIMFQFKTLTLKLIRLNKVLYQFLWNLESSRKIFFTIFYEDVVFLIFFFAYVYL